MSSLSNFIAGEWVQSRSENARPVHNPAAAEVQSAIAAAHKAFPDWRRMPLNERVQFLFRLKTCLEEHFDELSKTITLAESRSDLARRFRSEANVGNVGVAAPMAMFPFSGARGSFFGDLHGQGRDAFQFFTGQKVVVERWPLAVSRLF